MNISSALLLEIYRQSLVRHRIVSLVSFLVRPWPYRAAPAAGGTCGVCIYSIASSHAIPCYPIPTWTSRQVSQHSQHRSLQAISFISPVRSGRSVLLDKIHCFRGICFLFQKGYGQGRNAGKSSTLKTIHKHISTHYSRKMIFFRPVPMPVGVKLKHALNLLALRTAVLIVSIRPRRQLEQPFRELRTTIESRTRTTTSLHGQ